MSNRIGSILLERDILLESGTNEVEVLVFRVGVYRLGINVAKVREILPAQEITRLPNSHAALVGCFRLRDVVVPCVSLHCSLNQHPEALRSGTLILTEFNHSQTAFIVDQVERIHRMSWEKILPVPSIVIDVACPVTGVLDLEGDLVIMLDFESIAAQISHENQEVTAVANPQDIPRASFRVLVADDSGTVRKAIVSILRKSGYEDVICFEHGRQAWDWIREQLAQKPTEGAVADLLISDVEMPAMDGFHLTRNIKQHDRLSGLPVVLYSSILTPDNLKKGKAVGADAQITKPELSKVVELADEYAAKRVSRTTSGDCPATDSALAGAAAGDVATVIAAPT